MTKKSSASSRPAKRINASAESIWNKPLTETQKTVLKRVAKRQSNNDDSQINYAEIPAFTDKQLSQFRRPAKQLIAVRLDADVLEWLKQYGTGYSTRINSVLRAVMSQAR